MGPFGSPTGAPFDGVALSKGLPITRVTVGTLVSAVTYLEVAYGQAGAPGAVVTKHGMKLGFITKTTDLVLQPGEYIMAAGEFLVMAAK